MMGVGRVCVCGGGVYLTQLTGWTQEGGDYRYYRTDCARVHEYKSETRTLENDYEECRSLIHDIVFNVQETRLLLTICEANDQPDKTSDSLLVLTFQSATKMKKP